MLSRNERGPGPCAGMVSADAKAGPVLPGRERPAMLIDRHVPEDVFARVPEVAAQTDPVLRQLDPLLDDDPLFQMVKADLGRRYPLTLCRGRHSTPVEVILRLLVVQ